MFLLTYMRDYKLCIISISVKSRTHDDVTKKVMNSLAEDSRITSLQQKRMLSQL